MRTALKWTGVTVLALLVALALFLAFGLNLLRGPITKAVSDATGRELRIEGDFRTKWSWIHPRFRVEQVTFANADWGSADYLLSADAIEATVRLLPLLRGRVVVPEVHLEGAEVNLEQDAEGNRNWILDKDKDQEPKKESRIRIELLTLDDGRLNYDDAVRDISIQADLHTDETGLVFATSGTWQEMEVSGSGHTGQVLSIRDETSPFPIKAEASIGATRLAIDGEITGIIGLKGINTSIRLSGNSLSDLYDIIHVALPNTKPYSTSGRFIREGTVVRYEKFSGKVGASDLGGTIEVDTAGERPYMRGDLHSKVMDLGDLGMIVGTDEPKEDGVLPDMPFDPQRWDSVDADVRIKAGTIRRPEQLPIENLSARIQMKDRVLTLNPLEFGIAGGKLAGPIRLDGTRDTIRAELRMRIQNLKLAQLFPTLEQNKTSVGDIGGLVELKGAGNSVAQMLGSADGKIGAFMEGGGISRFMMELVALDLWNAARVKLKGDEQIGIRCAIADFGVKDGVANVNAFVFDTTVVNIQGEGSVNLKNEAMDLKLNPKPKHSSIASLNSPLYVRGTFSDPKPRPDVGKLAAKGAGAVVMGILNPLLAVLPLLKEGKDADSPCQQLIAEASGSAKGAVKAASSGQSAASGSTAKRPPSQSAR